MLDMRDAMLADDSLRNPAGARSANFCRLWESFAGRGHGRRGARYRLARVQFRRRGLHGARRLRRRRPSLPVVTVTVDVPTAREAGLVPGAFRFSRSIVSGEPLTIQYAISGTALNGTDYVARAALGDDSRRGPPMCLVPIVPIDDTLLEGERDGRCSTCGAAALTSLAIRRAVR